MKPKTFRIIIALAMAITLTAALLSLIGTLITGFYPAVVVLCAIAFIPIGSEFYAKKATVSSSGNLIALVVINVLSVLIVCWISFVITFDRIIPNFQ